MVIRFRKRALFTIILLILFIILLWWKRETPIKIKGETMGTTYHITYFHEKNIDYKTSVDSLLMLVNQSINTYDSTSEVSQLNQSSSFSFHLPYFLPPLMAAKQVFEQSLGAFDLTVMPLVNLWGFGWKKNENPDSIKIDSLMNIVGFNKVIFNRDSIWKVDPRIQLDFGGIGQGYGADVITNFLKRKGVQNMLVEVGGEGMAVGLNPVSDQPWKIGILHPLSKPDSMYYIAYAHLSNRAFTTSGNYFNYRIINGKKYAHTIDPTTGYPVEQSLVSVSVFADNCTMADAWGTALMVMGFEKAKRLLEEHPEIEAFLIYKDQGDKLMTYQTSGLADVIQIIDDGV